MTDEVTLAELNRRLTRLEQSIDRKLDDLMGSFADPTKSALGREVLSRHERNSERLDRLEEWHNADVRRFDRIESWVGIEDPPVIGRLPLVTMVERMQGVGSALRIQIILLTVIATILGIWVSLGRPGV